MSRRRIRVVGAMLEKSPGVYLITQRMATASLPLLWEFPGGKIEPDEAPAAALLREMKERVGVDVVVDELATQTTKEYPQYDLEFSVFRCALKANSPAPQKLRVNDFRWVTLEEMGKFKFPDADAKTLAQLLELES
jgi:8-oxo-dGTP diphosphatase